RSEFARWGPTTNPSRACRSARPTRSAQRSLPARRCSSKSPWTSPGTPTSLPRSSGGKGRRSKASPSIPAGAVSRKSMMKGALFSASQASTKPPPPMPLLLGAVTPATRAAAIAPSAAVPPARNTAMAASVAWTLSVAAARRGAGTVSVLCPRASGAAESIAGTRPRAPAQVLQREGASGVGAAAGRLESMSPDGLPRAAAAGREKVGPAEGPRPGGGAGPVPSLGFPIPMRFLFVMDPAARMLPDTDPTFAFLRSAQGRGHICLHCEPQDVSLVEGRVVARVRSVTVSSTEPFVTLGSPEVVDLTELDAIFVRKDPPFDTAYLHLTQELDLVKDQTLVVNDPAGLRDANEKLFAFRFARWMPRSRVTRSPEEILHFV